MGSSGARVVRPWRRPPSPDKRAAERRLASWLARNCASERHANKRPPGSSFVACFEGRPCFCRNLALILRPILIDGAQLAGQGHLFGAVAFACVHSLFLLLARSLARWRQLGQSAAKWRRACAPSKQEARASSSRSGGSTWRPCRLASGSPSAPSEPLRRQATRRPGPKINGVALVHRRPRGGCFCFCSCCFCFGSLALARVRVHAHEKHAQRTTHDTRPPSATF